MSFKTILTITGPDMGDGDLQIAARLCDADLMVMGAYGHSRLPERILGGVTRSILERPTLPVLLAR